MTVTPTSGLIALLRLPYWMMTGGLSLITAFAITKELIGFDSILLIFFSMACITSAGFSINDYFDRESDAITCFRDNAPEGMGRFGLIIASLSLSK